MELNDSELSQLQYIRKTLKGVISEIKWTEYLQLISIMTGKKHPSQNEFNFVDHRII